MTPIFHNNLGAAGYIIILQLVTIVFFGLYSIGEQSQSIDLKQQSIDIKEIVSQANETTLNTNEVVKSGRALNVLLQELQDFANQSEMSRQNQTQTLLPIFFEQFNQTDKIEETLTNHSILQASAKKDRITMINQLDSIISFLNETN